jgi:telomere length regulation protein
MDPADIRNQIHEFILKLHSPIADLHTLLSLLSTPLSSLGLLLPQYHDLLSSGVASPGFNLVPKKHFPQIQRALLTNILPTWYPILQENNALQLVEQYFCPDVIYNARTIAGEIALVAYATLVSMASFTEQAVALFEKLVLQYPIDRLFYAIFEGENVKTVKRNVDWEDCVRDLCAIPGKVANILGGQVPRLLENAVYFNALSVRTEVLIFSLSMKSPKSPGSLLCDSVFLSLRPLLRNRARPLLSHQ